MTTRATREAQVLSLAARIELVGAQRWPLCYSAPSLSHPGERHLVVLHRDGTADCDCVAHEYRRACVHIASAIMRYRAERAQRQAPLRTEGRCRRPVAVRRAA